MNWTKLIIWLFTIGVFVLAGWLVYDNLQNPDSEQGKNFVEIPEEYDWEIDPMEYDRAGSTKVIVCPITFNTMEFVSDSTLRCEDIQFGNFEPKEFCLYDRNFFLYMNPIKHNIEWYGKLPPTVATLTRSGKVKPYVAGAFFYAIENYKRDGKKCYFKEIELPDDTPIDQ